MQTRPPKYPWRRLRVGESFIVQGRTANSLDGCVSHLKPLRFKFRQMMLNGKPAVRVWRIA